MVTFPEMHRVIPEGQLGCAEITHFEVDAHASMFTAMRNEYVPVGKYAQLSVHGVLMMSDTQMERNSNYEVVRRATGRVLIAGLGLGMILHPILAKPEVTSVTVVEKFMDVIKLVEPTLPQEKLTLIEADIFTWKPARGTKWDTLYFDIWPSLSTDELKEMATLHRRFARCKAPNAWMASWMQDDLRARKRREARLRAWWR